MSGPLTGLKVLDLARYIAGPHCAMLLGDLGADVVKVERAKTGEDARGLAPSIGGESIYFMMFNRNKRSLTLDFRNPEAQKILRRLAAEADIVVENFRPGTMEKMGCGWEDLRKINRRLIMARLSGFGQNNSMTTEPCFDAAAQAISGIMELTGDPRGAPMMAGTFVVDHATALHATIGILAALQHRTVTGEGQAVYADLVGSAVSMLVTAIPEYLVNGRQLTRVGNRDRFTSPANTFRAKDGVWVQIVGGGETHFPRVARMLGQPELLNDPRFDKLDARMKNVDAIEAIVARWVGERSCDEVLAALRAAELPHAKVRTIAQVATDPYMREAGHIIDVEHPIAGTVPMPGPAVHLGATDTEVRLPSPVLGQHTEEVLREWIGLGQQGIADLRQAGAI